MTDQQRGDSVLPGSRSRMPHTRAFADEAVTFSEAYTVAPHCCPARASFFTGLYPTQHGVYNNICNDVRLSRGPKPGTVHWSEAMAEAGYGMYFTGKWHVSIDTRPKDHGWTEMEPIGAVAGNYHGQRWDAYRKGTFCEPGPRAYGHIRKVGYHESGQRKLFGPTDPNTRPGDEAIAGAAISKIRELGEADDGKPWCAYVGMHGPHDPFVVPQEFLDQHPLESFDVPTSFSDMMIDKPGLYRRMRRALTGDFSEEEFIDAVRHYFAYCSYMDHLFGSILKALDESGQRDNTVVIFTSDHGDYAGDHGLFCKGIPSFQGAYHIPLMVRDPHRSDRHGTTEDAFISITDFGPTLLALAGVDPIAPMAGLDFSGFLNGAKPDAWRETVHMMCNGTELYYTQRIVQSKRWKYVFNGFDEDELYDHENDPDEMTNLAHEPEAEAVISDLLRAHWKHAERVDDNWGINPYYTVSLFPEGPLAGLRD